MEKLWTTSEVAHYLGMSEAGVEALVREGQLTGYRLGGQFLRFRPSQVEALKGTVSGRLAPAENGVPAEEGGWQWLLDVFYFYDFYVVAAMLLVAMILYLIVAG